MVLGTFLKATSKVLNSQVATSQMCNFPSVIFPKVKLGPLMRRRLPSAAAKMGYGAERSSKDRFGKLLLGKILSGSCRLGKCLWEST